MSKVLLSKSDSQEQSSPSCNASHKGRTTTPVGRLSQSGCLVSWLLKGTSIKRRSACSGKGAQVKFDSNPNNHCGLPFQNRNGLQSVISVSSVVKKSTTDSTDDTDKNQVTFFIFVLFVCRPWFRAFPIPFRAFRGPKRKPPDLGGFVIGLSGAIPQRQSSYRRGWSRCRCSGPRSC